ARAPRPAPPTGGTRTVTIEDRLRAALVGRARHVEPSTDAWDRVASRLGTTHRGHRRLLALAAAVLVFGGLVAGWSVLSRHHGDVRVGITGPPQRQTSPASSPPTTVPSAATLPTPQDAVFVTPAR